MSGPRVHASPLELRSDAILHFDVGSLGSGGYGFGASIRALTGQSGAFVRTSTATATDAGGSTYTAPAGQPAYQWTGGVPGLLIRPADAPRTVESLTFTLPGQIVAHSGYLRFVDRGAGAVASARYLQWGSTGTRLIVSRATNGPSVNYNGGSGQVESIGAFHQTAGQLVELFWWLSATGTVRLLYRHDGGTIVERPESSGSTAPPVTPSATTVSIGHLAGANVGGIEVQRALIWPDPEATVAELEAAF